MCTDIVPFVEPDPDQREDALDVIRRHPFLQLLPLRTHDKRVPIRCLACRSRKQRKGKVFEGHTLDSAKTLRHFVDQHCVRPNHLSNLAKWVKARRGYQDAKTEVRPQTVSCEGLSLTNGEERFKPFRAELLHWARMIKLSAVFGKHKYTFNNAAEELTVFHEDCQKVVSWQPQAGEQSRPVCDKCNDWRLGSTATTSAIRFALKFWAARLLQAKLFKSQEEVQRLIEEMKDRPMYKIHPTKVNEILQWDLVKLQTTTRSSWLNVRRDGFTPQLKAWVDENVRCSAFN